MNTLKIENISFKYRDDRELLSNINFQLNNNEVVGLFGDSGSGKSTLCKVMSGYLENYKGNITLNNKHIEDGFNPVQLIFPEPAPDNP